MFKPTVLNKLMFMSFTLCVVSNCEPGSIESPQTDRDLTVVDAPPSMEGAEEQAAPTGIESPQAQQPVSAGGETPPENPDQNPQVNPGPDPQINPDPGGPQTSIPRPLGLWVLDNHDLKESAWANYKKWYAEENNTKQIFNLHKGDKTLRGDGVTWHARIEVHSGLEFQPGDGWHMFEATYQVDTDLMDGVNIAQMFDYSEIHPQIIVVFKDGHRVTFQSRGKGNTELASGYKNKPFTIKIRSNGVNEEVYFNGELRYSGKCANSASSARNGFRWGLYYNGIAPTDMHSEVTQVTRKKE